MEWQQIVGFYHVARLNSFTRAAEATFRTQSALSQQVKSLERELGGPLVERMGRGNLRLTPAGELLFDYCQSALDGRKHFLSELDRLRGRYAGRLCIAAPFTSFYRLLGDALTDFFQQYPDVEPTLLERTPQEIVDGVRNGEIDMGMVMASSAPKDLHIKPWKSAQCVLLTPSGHPVTTRKRISLTGIAEHPLILLPRNQRYAARDNLEEKLQAVGLPCRVVMESSNIVLSAEYARRGLGIAFAKLVDGFEEHLPSGLAVVPLNHLFKKDSLAVVYRRTKKLADYEQVFLDNLFAELGKGKKRVRATRHPN
jgi:DNA-binding transcriptional LysR family regulator